MRSNGGAPNGSVLAFANGLLDVNGSIEVVTAVAFTAVRGPCAQPATSKLTVASVERVASVRIRLESYDRGARGAFTSPELPPAASPGSTGLKLRSHANHSVRENGKKKNGRATQSTTAVTSILVHG